MAKLGTEVRAGLFVLAGVAVLVGFVIALGDFRLTPGTRIYGDFAYTGALQTGAPLMVSGVKVGRVADMQILGPDATPPPVTARVGLGRTASPLVRVALDVDDSVAATMGPDSLLHVGAQGLIGEAYVELTPKLGGDVLAAGAALRGVDAPRLHVMFLQLSSILTTIGGLTGDSDDLNLRGLSDAAGSLLTTVNNLIGEHRDELGQALVDVAASAAHLRGVLGHVQGAMGDGTAVSGLLNDTRDVAGLMRKELPELLKQARRSVDTIDSLATKANDAVDAEALAAALQDARRAAGRLDALTGEAQVVFARLSAGQGTAGALLQDPQVYDDLKELLRDLKRNPWKLMWRD